jgi:hypothetical protein
MPSQYNNGSNSTKQINQVKIPLSQNKSLISQQQQKSVNINNSISNGDKMMNQSLNNHRMTQDNSFLFGNVLNKSGNSNR